MAKKKSKIDGSHILSGVVGAAIVFLIGWCQGEEARQKNQRQWRISNIFAICGIVVTVVFGVLTLM